MEPGVYFNSTIPFFFQLIELHRLLNTKGNSKTTENISARHYLDEFQFFSNLFQLNLYFTERYLE